MAVAGGPSNGGMRAGFSVVVLAPLLGLSACSSAGAVPSRAVAPAPPPKDDGGASQGSAGSGDHSAVLEQLKIAPITTKADKQRSVLIPLPDAAHWTRVKFLTVPSLVGFRYGKDHHGIVGAFVTHVDDNTKDSACAKSFESWAMPVVEAFDVELHHEAPSAFSWTMPTPAAPDPKAAASPAPKKIAIVEVDALFAKTATVLSQDAYAAAWAAYPVWDNACLIVGAALPVRDDEARARAVRDRFVSDVFPGVVVTSDAEPKERY